MVRFVSKLLQESRIRVSAAPPPTIHQSFSRLPRNDRVNLECHTSRSVVRKPIHRLRIFTVNIPAKILRAPTNLLAVMLCLCRAILRWRFARPLFEDAVELRQRLEADRERDFAYAKINIEQKNVRLFDALAGDVIDKVYARYLFELFAQVIGADVDELRNFRQGKFFIRMLLDKLPRLPDFHRLSALSV